MYNIEQYIGLQINIFKPPEVQNNVKEIQKAIN